MAISAGGRRDAEVFDRDINISRLHEEAMKRIGKLM
jgi:hypothetical protein